MNGTSNFFVWSVLYFTIYFSIRSFSSPALYYSSKHTHFLKCCFTRVHHPPNRWTDFWSCLSVNCGYFTKVNELWQSTTPTDVNSEIHLKFLVCLTIYSLNSLTKWHPRLPFTVPYKSGSSGGCLVVIKRGFWFCFVFVYCIRWEMPYFLSANSTCLRI